MRGVEAMAEGKAKDAYALLHQPRHRLSRTRPRRALLAPCAAAAAGDVDDALARPALDAATAVAQFVADLDRAELHERLGRHADAETGFKALLAVGDESGIVTHAYGGFLERRGRWADAAALYKARAGARPRRRRRRGRRWPGPPSAARAPPLGRRSARARPRRC